MQNLQEISGLRRNDDKLLLITKGKNKLQLDYTQQRTRRPEK